MAYNTTSWGTDTNTNAPTGGSLTTTNHQYKSMSGGWAIWTSNDTSVLGFIPFREDTMGSKPYPNNVYTWATSGNLIKLYYVPSEVEDMTSTTLTVKAYRYRPDGNTNTGDVEELSNWTEINTATCTPSNTDRGVLITFTEANCSYNAGDLMCISMQSDENDHDGDSRNYISVIIKEDWNNIIDGNI
tara:strand:+ start:167 stop:727 length:561 start_codon:yes stop_codon:yes gene_type:complete